MTNAAVSDADVTQALRRYVDWMYGQPSADAFGGPTNTGGVIKGKNQGAGKHPWILPSCFHTDQRIDRTVDVPEGTPLLCVIADSYGGSYEMQAQNASDIQAAARNLDDIVQIQQFTAPGNPTVKTYDVHDLSVNIPADNPMLRRYQDLGYRGPARHTFIGYFKAGLVPGEHVTKGSHNIICKAYSPAKPEWKEPEWRNDLFYTIKVS